MEKKIRKDYVYSGFGFPVHLKNVTLFKIGKEWAPRINHEKVAKIVIKNLSKKESFTGNEIFFIRAFLKLTKVDFGKKLKVSHVAVGKWEKKREEVVSFQKGNREAINLLLNGNKKKVSLIKRSKLYHFNSTQKVNLKDLIGQRPISKNEAIKRVWLYLKKHEQSRLNEIKVRSSKKKATHKSTVILRYRKKSA